MRVEHVMPVLSSGVRNGERDVFEPHSWVSVSSFITYPAAARITPPSLLANILSSSRGCQHTAPGGADKESRPRAVKGISVDFVLADDPISTGRTHQQQQWQDRSNALGQQQLLEWDQTCAYFDLDEEVELEQGQAALNARDNSTEFKNGGANKEGVETRSSNELLSGTQKLQLSLDRRSGVAALCTSVGEDLFRIPNVIAENCSFGRSDNLATQMRLLATTGTRHIPVVYNRDSCSIYCHGPGDPDPATCTEFRP